MKPKLIPLLALAASAPLANASIFIQELFDDISTANATLNGAGDTATSLGLTGTWLTNGSTGIFTANNFNVVGATLPGLPPKDAADGGIWNNTTSWNTNIYATRPLSAPIDFGVDRTIYFSVNLNNPGDTSMGVGLASGDGPTAQFVGAGFTWNNAIPLGSTANIAGNSAFISHGVLDNTVENGVYGIRAYEGQGTVNAHGLLVGRITIRATGNDEIHIKRYAPNAVIDNDLGAIVWSSSSTVNSSMLASHILLWMNGQGSGELDAIRFGDTWTDVTGVTLAGSDQPALSSAAVTNVTGTAAQANVNLFTSAANVTLHWDTIDQGTGTWGNSNPLGNKAIGPVSGNITGLVPDSLYFYRFQAVNTVPEPDKEGWSEAGTSFVTALSGLAVEGLEAYGVAPFEVDLIWNDNFNTETGFIIERRPSSGGAWVQVGTAPAGAGFHTDKHSGLAANTSYDYRVLAVNPAGTSDPSTVATATTTEISAFETQLLINFDGTLDGTVYTLGNGELDNTGTFKANGAPVVNGGLAVINQGALNGQDGFDIDPASIGNLTTMNWVAETVITYQGGGFVMDVQGDCNVRLGPQLSIFYWDGNTAHQQSTTLPPAGVRVHLAYAWNAGTSTLTGYVNGVPFGSATGAFFARPDLSNLSFGYFGRTGYVGNGVDGTLDAIAFQTGSAEFNPATGFLILPETQSFSSWIGGFPVGALNGFDDDADGDGLSNGLEAFLGTNPSATNGSPITQVSSNGTVTTFTHPKASPPLSDVTGSYQWSPDLATWYAGDGVDGPSGGPTVSIPLTGSSTVTATSSAPLGKLFIRIEAEN